jgi:hypothetical protein
MQRQDIINFAGVGYIQGMCLTGLTQCDIEIEGLRVDGMFGPKTIEALDLLISKCWKMDVPKFVDKRDFNSPDVWEKGIQTFQEWFINVYNHIQAHEHSKRRLFTRSPETDGKWGDKTQLQFLIIFGVAMNNTIK